MFSAVCSLFPIDKKPQARIPSISSQAHVVNFVALWIKCYATELCGKAHTALLGVEQCGQAVLHEEKALLYFLLSMFKQVKSHR